MSPATREKAKAKLHAIADKIGYPEHWRDYSKLEVTRTDALGNLQRANVFENDRQLNKIRQARRQARVGRRRPPSTPTTTA